MNKFTKCCCLLIHTLPPTSCSEDIFEINKWMHVCVLENITKNSMNPQLRQVFKTWQIKLKINKQA